MGALCKADGVVTRDEIATAEAMFDRLHLSGQQREQAKAAFNRGKSPAFDLDAEVSAFARVARGQRALLVMFLQIQCSAIAGDGSIHPAEHQLLGRIARLLGLSEADVAQLEALLRTGARGPGFAGSARPMQSRLDDAYSALGLPASASDAEVKKVYRRLISQNHPGQTRRQRNAREHARDGRRTNARDQRGVRDDQDCSRIQLRAGSASITPTSVPCSGASVTSSQDKRSDKV